MKRIHAFYWSLALIGFLLPVSRSIIVELPTLFSATFVYLLSFGFKTKAILSLAEVIRLFLSLGGLCFYLYQLLSLSIDMTKKAKIGYSVSVYLYSVTGSVYLLMKQPTVAMSVVVISYFVILSASTYMLTKLKA